MTKDELLYWIDIFLNNIFIKFNNKIYQQVIGIPTGSNCSQELANLYLLSYEYEHVIHLIEEGLEEATYTQFNSRYIDDLLSFNDMGYMELVYTDIYPKEMVLNKTNTTSISADYLDVHIEIVNDKFVTSLYDKGRDYKFKVISLPHMTSNDPIWPTYGVFISRIHSFYLANNKVEGFYSEVKNLTAKLVKQEYLMSKMKYHLAKYFTKHFFVAISRCY